MNHRSMPPGLGGAVRFLTVVAFVCGAFVAAVIPRPAEAATTQCTGTLTPGTYPNVNVPAGATCTLPAGTVVQGDVKVQPGGTLIDQGATVGRDIVATSPKGIAIDGVGQLVPGKVGHDIVIDGLTGFPTGYSKSGHDSICDTNVAHDVTVKNSASSAALFSIGDMNGDCASTAPLTVGHNLNALNNASTLFVDSNTVKHDLNFKSNPGAGNIEGNMVTHDLTVTNNANVVVANNQAGHDATCNNNSSTMNFSNTAGHTNTCNF